MPFLVQNCDLEDDRCYYQQLSILTGIKNQISSKLKLLQLLLKTIVTIEFITLCNYGLKDKGVNIDRCQIW